MRDILSQLHKSFLSIGLEDAAKQIRVAQSLYKDDFKTEVRIFNSLANILEDLKELKHHQIYKKNAFLPGYAIETASERIVKDEEPLEGYTKKEIIAGINNYLQSFIKNYMDVKYGRISYENESKYSQAINTISASLKEIQQVSRGVSKSSVQKSVNRVTSVIENITPYLRILKDAVHEVKNQDPKTKKKWESLPSTTLVAGGSSWAEVISNMEFNKEVEALSIEKEYIKSHDIDEEDFYRVIKSFRAHIVESSSSKAMTKFAEDDEADIDLNDPEPPQKEKTEPAQPAAKPRPSLFTRDDFTDSTNYRSIVFSVVKNNTPFSKDKTGKKDHSYSPQELYKAYTRFLLPQFRTQYESLISVAWQSYLSMYQVQAVQNKLAKSLRLAAKVLGG